MYRLSAKKLAACDVARDLCITPASSLPWIQVETGILDALKGCAEVFCSGRYELVCK